MKKIVMWMLICLFAMSPAAEAAFSPYSQSSIIEGFILNIVDNRVEVEAYDGTVQVLFTNVSTVLTIDGRAVSLIDLKPGMEIYAEKSGRTVTYLESYATENLGYIAPGSKVRTGTVKTIDRNQIVLKSSLGKEETYFTSPATVVRKKGRNVPLSVLYEGDHVKLHFDSVDTMAISRMEIEGDTVVIKDIYRGKIQAADHMKGRMTLEDVSVLRNGEWETYKSILQLPILQTLPLYAGGQKIAVQNLKYYCGKDVYIAVKDFCGQDRIEKMVIKSRYETVYSDRIKTINWYGEAMELNNNKNLSFNEGTLIVKNGRLLDTYALQPEMDALIVADGKGGTQTADIVQIYNEDINHSNIGQNYVYAGRLDEIVKDQVVLKDFFLLEKNEWQSYDDDKALYYDNDTAIYDMEAGKFITPEAFYAGVYAVDEDSGYVQDHHLKDWYGYIYTDGDRICSIMVQKDMDSLLGQRISKGMIQTVTEDPQIGWTLQLMDVCDWSSRKDKWLAKKVPVRMNLEKALIIKAQTAITPEDLRPGDRLYVLRDDFAGKIVIVK